MGKIVCQDTNGLITSGRQLDLGTRGYAQSSSNMMIRQKGVYQPRFGLEEVGASSSAVTRIFYNPISSQFIRSGTTSNLLQTLVSDVWTDLDTTRKYSAYVFSRKFAYLLSNEGLRRVNSANTSTEIAYVPPGLDMELTSLGGSGIMPANCRMQYRVVWGVKNSQDEFFLGAPGSILTVTNSSTTATGQPNISFTVPSDITTSYFYQIYRTRPSANANIDPDPTFSLVFEAFPTSGEISSRLVTFSDLVPQGNGGAQLYTNQGQQGDGQANYPCESATGNVGQGELAVFANCLFATNYQPRSNIDITLLSVSSTNGLSVNDTIVINGVTYTAKSTENIASREFAVSSSTSASVAVRDTAQSFIRVFNRSTSNTDFYAYYLSGADTLPGRMRIVARTRRDSTATIQCSARGQAFFPNIGAATNILSKNEPSWLVYSKPNEPQSFPLPNIVVMPQNATIYGITPLRAALIIETSAGYYRLTGSYQNFTLDLIDKSTVPLVSTQGYTNGMVVANNTAYALTNKGLVAITESQVRTVGSTPSQLSSYAMPDANLRLSFHRGDNVIMVPVTYGTFVYHVDQDAWLTWPDSFICGDYDVTSNKIMLQRASDNLSCRQRGGQYLYYDFIDKRVATNIDAVGTNSVTLSSVPSGTSVGDVVERSGVFKTITAINGSTLTVEGSGTLTTGAAFVNIGFTCSLTYASVSGGFMVEKDLTECDIMLDTPEPQDGTLSTKNVSTAYPRVITVSYTTDNQPTTQSVTAVVYPIEQATDKRFLVPRSSKRAAVFSPGFSIRVCRNNVRVVGMTTYTTEESTRTNR